MKKLYMILSVFCLAFCITSCEKDKILEEGTYLCEDDQFRLVGKFEKIGDFEVHWTLDVTSDQQDVIRTILLNMQKVPSGMFTMGTQNVNAGTENYYANAREDEMPIHTVNITKSYYICKYEITQREWQTIMKSNIDLNDSWIKEYGRGDNYPAYNLAYNDLEQYIIELNRLTGLQFRMPTEAEWEFAARGAKADYQFCFSGSEMASSVAWTMENSYDNAHIVGSLSPNELGLFDMSGNVWEWCADEYDLYTEQQQIDPLAHPNKSNQRCLRGGAWCYSQEYARVTCRDKCSQNRRCISNGGRLAL